MRNIPPDPDESIGELVEHFFLVNHPDHYLTHQVIFIFYSLVFMLHWIFLSGQFKVHSEVI